jgi:hypothetical protein
MKHQRSRDELVEELKDQVGFLERSAESFDAGYEGEAKRLAATLRVLLHDHGKSSRSLLSQLDLKEGLQFLDTAEPIVPTNLLPTPGLVVMHLKAGPEGGAGRYEPRFRMYPDLEGVPIRFEPWWNESVAKDGEGVFFSRRNFVLTVANKEGGAHVDPSLNEEYAALTRRNSMGWMAVVGEDEAPFEGNIAFSCVRQIAWETIKSLHRDLEHLLGGDGLGRLAMADLGRNDPCPCGSGKKFKKCHAA